MKKIPLFQISIVYHSDYGHTQAQAQGVARGVAAVDGVKATLIAVEEVEHYWDQLNTSHAIIFGCPTYMGSASAAFKAFMEKSVSLWVEQKWKDKISAGFTNSGSLNGDKLNTLLELWIFAAQHGMIWVPLGLLPGRSSEALNRLGSFGGAMSQADYKDPVAQAPSPADLQTAESLGKTVSLATKRWYKEP